MPPATSSESSETPSDAPSPSARAERYELYGCLFGGMTTGSVGIAGVSYWLNEPVLWFPLLVGFCSLVGGLFCLRKYLKYDALDDIVSGGDA